ncbi:MAG: hypothetical protein ACOZAK_03025 [Patescibacteria group bacterium]
MTKLIYQDYAPCGLQKNKNISNSSRLAIKEAEKFGIDWEIIPGTQIVKLTYNKKERFYYHQIPCSTTALAKYVCNNKQITSRLLKRNGISVPNGFRIRRTYDASYLKEIFVSLKKPIVVKPNSGTWGENVTTSINSYQQYLTAIKLAFNYSGSENTTVMVEEMFKGDEFRILVSREKVIGVLKRVPANIIGDGINTIEKLINLKNLNRGNKGSNKSHFKIRMDKKLQEFLLAQKLSFKFVPQKGEQIFLRMVSNVSQGGDAIDYTDKVHQSVKEIALKTISTIPGLSFTGIDFMTKDITKPQTRDSYVIIEINDSPGFDIHDYPYQGKNRHAAKEFLFLIFPELREKNNFVLS